MARASKVVTRANALASVGVAIEGASRDFSYVDRLTPTLRPYSLSAAPRVAISAEIYPAARTDTPVLKGLGATFDYALAFGLAQTFVPSAAFPALAQALESDGSVKAALARFATPAPPSALVGEA